MDSMKTNLLQQQEFPKKNTQKPFILSLIFVLTLIVVGILTVTTVIVIRQSSPSSDYTYVEPTPSKSILAICSFAPYKHLCSSSLLSIISPNTSSTNEFDTNYLSPENIIFHSFQVAVTQLTHLANIIKPNTAEPVLLECHVLLNRELSGLNDSVSSSRNFYYFTKIEVDEYVVIFNTMETYQQACLDKLEESTAAVINEIIRLNVEKTRRYMSNTAAVLQNIDSIMYNIFRDPSSSGTEDYYSYYFDGLSYEYMIIFVPQYVFLILLFILMLKLLDYF